MKLNTEIANDILVKNIKREHRTFSKYACLSKKAFRFKEDELSDRKNIRPPFFHDTDRIIHSLAYTRYIDKTQVFYLFENDNITHRVLHVQLVSKIARVIGRALSLNEDLIEAISLGHDLGHVPYGHNGEKMLNKLTHKHTGEYFCHNAQSVRALHYLEDKGNGLNLTVQVLDGILCHNGELMQKEYKPDYRKTKEQFIKESISCWTTKGYSAKIIAMTLEGCVMRIADIVAYIGRDIEDAITLKLIKREEIPEVISKIIGDTNATIINNFVIDIINNSYGKDYIKLSDEIYEAIDAFHKFSNEAIYQNPQKTTQDDKINKMFEMLFQKYLDDLESGKNETSISKYLEEMSDDYKNNTTHPRIVCDFIAGMTDDYFNNEFKNFVIPRSFGYNIIQKG